MSSVTDDEDFSLGYDTGWLLEEAHRRTGGLEDLGGEPFREPLELFVNSLETEAMLTPFGKLVARERCLGHICNRLLYVNDRKRFPEIAQETIEKPMFIIGFPRTGTTILHDILAQDPANRAPMTWEVMFPSPPPETATFETDPRIDQCQALMPQMDELQTKFKAMHPLGARLTQECVMMMGDAMSTPLFHNQFRVPKYQDWVDATLDRSPVYDFHKQQLQHLQSRHKLDRWVLKTGAHLWGLEHLLTTYPDARIVFTHRDPVKSLTSFSSLTALVRSMGSNHVDRAEVSEDWISRLAPVWERVLKLRAEKSFPNAILYDVMFPDFVHDQFAVVEQIYKAFDLPMSEDGARRMKAFIDDNPQGKYGVHRYSPEEYFIDPDDVRARFRAYIERFDLKPE
jgi:hypothetical protein